MVTAGMTESTELRTVGQVKLSGAAAEILMIQQIGNEPGGSGTKSPPPVQEVMRSNLGWEDIYLSVFRLMFHVRTVLAL